MSTHSNNTHGAPAAAAHHEPDMTKGKIWKVFFYLLFLTALEFIIALGFVHTGIISKGMAVNVVYIVLTLLKAYYIIAYFMHLKFEAKSFIIIVSSVFVLIIYLIILMLIEGNYLLYNFSEFPWWPNP